MARGRLFVDLAPLRQSQAFRRLWGGYLVTTLGSQLTVVAIPYQVFKLTHSSFDVGLVGMAQIVPVLAGSLFGGAIADAVDRRVLLVITQLSLALCSLGLALNSLGDHPSLWPLYALSALASGIASVDNPTRSAVLANLVERAMFVSANALWQLLYQVGPGRGSRHRRPVARRGRHRLCLLDRRRQLRGVSLAAVASLPSVRPPGGGTRFGLGSIAEGLRFLKGRSVAAGGIRHRP